MRRGPRPRKASSWRPPTANGARRSSRDARSATSSWRPAPAAPRSRRAHYEEAREEAEDMELIWFLGRCHFGLGRVAARGDDRARALRAPGHRCSPLPPGGQPVVAGTGRGRQRPASTESAPLPFTRAAPSAPTFGLRSASVLSRLGRAAAALPPVPSMCSLRIRDPQREDAGDEQFASTRRPASVPTVR